MNAERFRQIERLFHAAVGLDAAARAALLQREATADPELRRAVTRLLEAEVEERTSGALERLFTPEIPDELPLSGPLPGQSIGPYRLVRELGRGGAGVVFEAEQSTPRRRVALKLLHTTPPAAPAQPDELLHEAEILARLNHPAIASMYAAGYTDAGQPYLVMELVEGQRIDKYARRRPRGGRLQLFLKICDGIAYAHDNGVIHRDLKPSNVLVKSIRGPAATAEDDDATLVKILDFGLAKYIDPDATWTLFSGPSIGWGTLPYMSPEQRRGGRVDKRTDIYALGVMLFKLMTDELPHPVEGLALPEAWYRLEHDPPRRPSQLDPALRGDLETIILAAIADEPARRYQSVAELADDIRRYLSDRPLTRRPPSRLYELRKFARRNRVLVAVLLAVFLGLAAAAGGLALGYNAAKAAHEATVAQAVESSYLHLLKKIRVEQRLVKAAGDRGQPRLCDAPALKDLDEFTRDAETIKTVAGARDATRLFAQLVELSSVQLAVEHWYTATLRGFYGECLTDMRRLPEARAQLARSYDDLRTALGPTNKRLSKAIVRLYSVCDAAGDHATALQWFSRMPPAAAPEAEPALPASDTPPAASPPETQPASPPASAPAPP